MVKEKKRRRKSTVYIVDDDQAVLRSLEQVCGIPGREIECFESGVEFLERTMFLRPACIVLDIRMPKKDGLEVFRQLEERGINIPVIFLTGHADVSTAVKLLQDGAVDFLEKPCIPPVLLRSVEKAISIDTDRRRLDAGRRRFEGKIGELNEAHIQVLELLVAGYSNKQIADNLKISLRTVQLRRTRIMDVMETESLEALVSLYVAFS